MRILTNVSPVFLALALLGAGCSTIPPYVPGEMPTEAQLQNMTPEETEAGMQAMMEKDPPPELSEDEQHDELMNSIGMMKSGSIERFADFQGKNIHSGGGNVKIVKNGDRYQLVFSEDFSVTPGPYLVVHVSHAGNPGSAKELKQNGTIELGRLKGFSGVQTYDLPEDFNLDQAKSVVIFCKPFQVVFAVATFQ